MNNLYVNMKAIKVELSCVNCVLDHSVDFEKQSMDDLKWVEMSGIVFDDFKCTQCGCNSFNAKLYYELSLK